MEPDMIDMMSEDELRIELRKVLKENAKLKDVSCPKCGGSRVRGYDGVFIEEWSYHCLECGADFLK